MDPSFPDVFRALGELDDDPNFPTPAEYTAPEGYLGTHNPIE